MNTNTKAAGIGGILIAGLGNPGAKYETTRHNVGFLAIDAISRAAGIGVSRKRFQSLTGEGLYKGVKLVLLKPQTYMNLSGEAVYDAARYYRTEQENLILIYDDTDIPLGSIRVRAFGSPGTHNGMRSVTDYLGDGARFPRVRIGIGGRPDGMELSAFVLSGFHGDEKEAMTRAISMAADAALCIAAEGIDRAMNRYNPQKVKTKKAQADDRGADEKAASEGAEKNYET